MASFKMPGRRPERMAKGVPTTQPENPLTLGTKLAGCSGRTYEIERILQERTEPVLAFVYLAKYIPIPSLFPPNCRSHWPYRDCETQKKLVLKNIYHTEFEYQLDMQRPLTGHPNLRLVADTVPEHLLFVYEYLSSNLLSLALKNNLSSTTRRQILRDALTGLAGLHGHGIFHTGKGILFIDSFVVLMHYSSRRQTKQHICQLR